MKRFIDSTKVFASMLLLGCAFSFVACGDDDENAPQIPDNPDSEVTTDVMFGNYTGKMVTYSMNPLEDGDAEDTEDTVGVDISAIMDNDTIYFEDFPIRDIVFSIVKDEALTDRIVEAVGEVCYKIGYEPNLTTDKDSIMFVMNPESLKLSVSMPSDTEGEEVQSLQIEVKVDAGNTATYAVETQNAQFDFAVTEVLLGEGEEQTPLSDFNRMTFKFNMNQSD